MKIYTKTGDKGETGLLAGGRTGKDTVRIQAYGTVDECNAVLGIVRTHDIGEQLDEMLNNVQHKLFVVGSDLATPGGQRTTIDRISDEDVEKLEADIDLLEKTLPTLKAFILPGGSPGASYLHLARTICRRAERLAVTLSREEATAVQIVKYLNRLSDFLFVAARSANLHSGIDDRLWDSPRRKKKD
jgi:cob(I)alamin adenosyltransferase